MTVLYLTITCVTERTACQASNGTDKQSSAHSSLNDVSTFYTGVPQSITSIYIKTRVLHESEQVSKPLLPPLGPV